MADTSKAGPPGVTRFLVELLLRGEAAETIHGDMEEGFDRRVRAFGINEARRWYRRQALGSVWALLLARLVGDRGPTIPSKTGDGFMMTTLLDIRYAIRGLRKGPGFAALATLTLGLGIGANASIFSVVNGVLLRPLSFEEPDRLVGVWHRAPGAGVEEIHSDEALFFTYREQNRVFDDIASWKDGPVSITGLTEPEQVPAIRVTAGLFPLLRTRPSIGRNFTNEDDTPGAPETVILSHAYWQRQFGSDPLVLGQLLRVDGRSREIVGVLPPEFALPRPAMIYLPLQWDRAQVRLGNFNGGQAVARLSVGTTIAEANADVDRMIPIAVENFSGATLAMLQSVGFSANVRPFKQDFVGDIGNTLWVLLGTVGLVLLIACSNVANLFLVRAEGRQLEIAVRTAIGASRGRLARQLLSESLVVGLAGGACGLGFAAVGVMMLTRLGPEGLPRLREITIDPGVIGFTIGLSVVAGLLFGLVPLSRIVRQGQLLTLREGSRGGGIGRQGHQVRSTLVIAQTALALVLLAGSGLMLRTFQEMREVDPGFSRPEEVFTFRVDVPRAEVEGGAEVALAYEEMWRRLKETQGVTSVGASSSLTLDFGYDMTNAIYIEHAPVPPDEAPPIRQVRRVTGEYFETMRNPLLVGRSIRWSDIRERNPVAVVSENFARENWGVPEAAMGQRIAWGDPNQPIWREIVGVVGNVRADGLSQPAPPVVFWPMAMMNVFRNNTEELVVQRSMAFAVRTGRSIDATFVSEVREAIRGVNPNFALANIRTLDEILDRSMARTSFTLVMLVIAALVALALGLVGIYGVTSYLVLQRTREIGVRMALGAGRHDVSRMIVLQGMVPVGIGVVVGLLAAVALTDLMSSLLYGVEATDPATFGVVAILLSGVAFVASYVPAMRAARADPLESLRFE